MLGLRERAEGILEGLVRGGPLHPNKVSAYGLGFTGAAVTAGAMGNECAPFLYAGALVCDWADGFLARKYNVQTVEGASLDPFVDKAKHLAVSGLMISTEVIGGAASLVAKVAVTASVAYSLGVDGVSQALRGNLIEQVPNHIRAVVNPDGCTMDQEVKSNIRANWYGKIKAGVQGACHLAILTYMGYRDEIHSMFGRDVQEDILQSTLYGVSAALVASAVCGTIGIVKRQKK